MLYQNKTINQSTRANISIHNIMLVCVVSCHLYDIVTCAMCWLVVSIWLLINFAIVNCILLHDIIRNANIRMVTSYCIYIKLWSRKLWFEWLTFIVYYIVNIIIIIAIIVLILFVSLCDHFLLYFDCKYYSYNNLHVCPLE